jgi:hypothetical protein
MIATNQSISIVCGGSNAVQAKQVCFQSGCSAYALICGNVECQCMAPHKPHQFKLLQELLIKLHTPPTLSEEYIKTEKSINGFIDNCIASLSQLKTLHH